MAKSKPAIYSDLAKVDATTDEDIARQIAEDPDTAPELTDEWFDKADLHYGELLLRRGRGRPALDSPKKLISLRLHRDAFQRIRAAAPASQPLLTPPLPTHP